MGNRCSGKLLPEAVTGEGTRLAHQRADDVAVIDVGFTFTAHPFHAFTTQPRPQTRASRFASVSLRPLLPSHPSAHCRPPLTFLLH